MKNYKISIVTPSFNSEKYIEKTILSIKNQDYNNYEHIIIDGGSTDNTLDIIKKYENTYPMRWISEKDHGMYDAINKGFSLATGDIYAWINSDDIYLPGAFRVMNLVMQDNRINWCTTGQTAFINEKDIIYFINRTFGPRSYSRYLILKGLYNGKFLGYIQQEGTFWRKEVWVNLGGVDIKNIYAGDYWLWLNFAKSNQLYAVNTVISAFRRRKGQLSSNIAAYTNELKKMSPLHEFIAKSKISYLVAGLFHPSHKYLLQIEKLSNVYDK